MGSSQSWGQERERESTWKNVRGLLVLCVIEEILDGFEVDRDMPKEDLDVVVEEEGLERETAGGRTVQEWRLPPPWSFQTVSVLDL